MASQIFIAHTERDQQTAAAVCSALERNGMRGWLAFRDVPMGMDPRTALMQAIDASAACVLILSPQTDNAALIEQVRPAIQRELPLIALRLESTFPTQALAEALRSAASVYAGAIPSEAQLGLLVRETQNALARSPQKAGPTATPLSPQQNIPPLSSPGYAPTASNPAVPTVPPMASAPSPPVVPPVGYTSPPPSVPVAPASVPNPPAASGPSYAGGYGGAPGGAPIGGPGVAPPPGNYTPPNYPGYPQGAETNYSASAAPKSSPSPLAIVAGLGGACILLLVIIAAVAFSKMHSDNDTTHSNGNWKTFTASDAGYSILMPGTPTPQTQYDGSTKVNMYVGADQGTQYIASYFEAPGAEANSAFDILQKAKVDGLQGTLEDAHDVTLGSLHGRDFTVSNPQKPGVKDARFEVFLSNGRLFQFMIMGDKSALNGYDADRFFDSISINYPDSQAPPSTTRNMPAGWNVFTPPGNEFSIVMPGSPQFQTKTDGGVTITMYISSDGATQYLASYFDIDPSRASDPRQAIDTFENAKAQAEQGTIAEEQEINVGPYTGKEFVLRNMQVVNGLSARFHVFLVGSRVFQLMVMGNDTAIHSADADAFFNSIHTGGM